ncbi:hypothetical protein KI387_044416, partial [Taxus chinensis]
DVDTRAGHLETISGLLDMGRSGGSPGGVETEQGGYASQARYVGVHPIYMDIEVVRLSIDSSDHLQAIQ